MIVWSTASTTVRSSSARWPTWIGLPTGRLFSISSRPACRLLAASSRSWTANADYCHLTNATDGDSYVRHVLGQTAVLLTYATDHVLQVLRAHRDKVKEFQRDLEWARSEFEQANANVVIESSDFVSERIDEVERERRLLAYGQSLMAQTTDSGNNALRIIEETKAVGTE